MKRQYFVDGQPIILPDLKLGESAYVVIEPPTRWEWLLNLIRRLRGQPARFRYTVQRRA